MIVENQTMVETHKNVTGKKKPNMTILREYFGPMYGWCLPFFITNKCNLLEKTYSEDGHDQGDKTFADEYFEEEDPK